VCMLRNWLCSDVSVRIDPKRNQLIILNIQVWGEVSMGGGYLPHIVNCSLVVFTLHAAVPVTALNTKEFAR
jgi:hypothetical protein